MPSKFRSKPYTQLNLGLNLRGITGGITNVPGESQDNLDMHILEDGSIEKHWGWERVNTTALTGRPVGIKGFTYRGKNATVTGGSDTARAGNYGIADDGADFTKRGTLYSGCIVLTDSTFYRWEPATQAFVSVSLPSGASVSLHPKPSFIIYNDNVYISGWASFNLRYDPTDEALYRWGWETMPTAPTVAASAGGTLQVGQQYKYAYAHLDVYTGEESPITEVASQPTIAGSNRTITVSMTAYAEATEARHFNTLAVATDSDVGYVVYRSDAGRERYNFLAVVQPGNTDGAASAPGYVDSGDATEASIHPYERANIREAPNFNFITLFKDQFYGVSYGTGPATFGRPNSANRIYWNHFKAENSFVERYDTRGYRALPLPEGETLTSIGQTATHLIPFTQKGAYGMSVTPNYATGKIGRVTNRLPWNVGCIGAVAHTTVNGWLYFLSERGPYRFRSGAGEPQWLGKGLLPMFLDTGGVCQLTPGMQSEAEVNFDQDSNTVRFIFACGSSEVLNRHLTYWVDTDKFLPAPYYGWMFASPNAQCFDRTLSLTGLAASGAPQDPQTRAERLVFGDDDGYINTYEIDSQRAGIPGGSAATGTVVSATASTVTCTTASNPLFSDGDGLAGLFIEIVRANGTSETHKIASSTTTVVTIVDVWEITPTTSDTWYVAGIPAFWRSWVDSIGMPHDRKSMLHLMASYYLTDVDGTAGSSIAVTVLSDDRGLNDSRTRTALLNDYNDKMLVSRTGLFFTYEFANTFPDQMFTLTAIEPEFAVLGDKRRE